MADGQRRGRAKRGGLRAAVCALLFVAAAARADLPARGLPDFAELEAAGATIGEIRVVVNDVFDTDDPREDKSFYRAANALHITTRPGVIRRRLLFRSGEPVSVRVIEETERLLRRARYLYDVRIRPIAVRDNVVDIEVATRDTWTLYPAISVSRSGGANKTEFSLQDSNLAGTATNFSYGYTSDVDRSSRTLQVSNDNAFGRWVTAAVAVSRNSDGSKESFALVRPFHALDARWSAGVRAVDDDRIDAVYTAGDLASEFRRRERRAEAFGGWSRGLADGWVSRYTVGIDFAEDRYALAPGRVAPAALPADDRRIGPFVGYELIEDRFERTRNRNQMGRPEYFAVGLAASLRLAWAATRFGSTDNVLAYEARLSRGFEAPGEQLVVARADVEGQYRQGEVRRQQTGAGLQYFLPHHGRWVFYTELAGDVLTRPDPAEFLYLGGDNGLRGYPLRYQGGTRRALLTVEERLYTGAFPLRLIRIGAAAFVDVGRAWGGGNVNAADPGWLANAGFGLRFFSVRTAFGNVAHLDVAFPLNPAPGIDRVQILLRGRASF